jgi:hypothetical protein
VLFFNGEVIVERNRQKMNSTHIAEAIELERRVRRAAEKELDDAIKEIQLANIHGERDEDAEARQGKAFERIKASKWFLDLYRAIKHSLKATTRKHVFGVRVSEKEIDIHLRAPMTDIFRTRNGIWIDGTPSLEIWMALFGRMPVDLSIIDIPVKPGAYKLTAYVGGIFSRSFLTENAKLGQLRSFILERSFYWRGRRDHRCRSEDGRVIDVVIILDLKVKEALLALFGDRVPDNVAFEHFGHIRGVDLYRDAPCGIIVGRTMPGNETLELMREALDYDNPNIDQYISAPVDQPALGHRRLLMADGTAVSVPCELHPDVSIEQLRQQVSDAEVCQAAHRLRIYERAEDNWADLHVFGPVDVGLPIHVLADWGDAKWEAHEVVRASGVWSGQPEMLARLGNGILAGLSQRTLKNVIAADKRDQELRTQLQALNGDGRTVADSTESAKVLEEEDLIKENCTTRCIVNYSECWTDYPICIASLPKSFVVSVHERHADPLVAIERELGYPRGAVKLLRANGYAPRAQRASLAALQAQVNARKAAAANDAPAPANDNKPQAAPRVVACQSQPDPRKCE